MVNATLSPLNLGRDQIPIVQGAEWASGPSWSDIKHLAPPGFDVWTVQPVASHYTDRTNPAPDKEFLNVYNQSFVNLKSHILVPIFIFISQLHSLPTGHNKNNNYKNIILVVLITKYLYQHQAQPKNRMRCCGLHICVSEEGPNR